MSRGGRLDGGATSGPGECPTKERGLVVASHASRGTPKSDIARIALPWWRCGRSSFVCQFITASTTKITLTKNTRNTASEHDLILPDDPMKLLPTWEEGGETVSLFGRGDRRRTGTRARRRLTLEGRSRAPRQMRPNTLNCPEWHALLWYFGKHWYFDWLHYNISPLASCEFCPAFTRTGPGPPVLSPILADLEQTLRMTLLCFRCCVAAMLPLHFSHVCGSAPSLLTSSRALSGLMAEGL